MTEVLAVPYARRADAPAACGRALRVGLLSCAVGLLANGVPAYFIVCLLRIPPGTLVRPMVEVGMIFLGSLGGLAVGVPLGLACIVLGRRWWVGWMIGLLGIARISVK